MRGSTGYLGSLAPIVANRGLAAVRAAAAEEDTAVLLVEQHTGKAPLIPYRVSVLRRGRIDLAGEAASFRGRTEETVKEWVCHALNERVALLAAEALVVVALFVTPRRVSGKGKVR